MTNEEIKRHEEEAEHWEKRAGDACDVADGVDWEDPRHAPAVTQAQACATIALSHRTAVTAAYTEGIVETLPGAGKGY